MTRAAILCPGRGSYTEASLGCLTEDHEWMGIAEELRDEAGLEPLLELDGAARFQPARHLRPANVSALIYVRSMLDAARALEDYQVVCVGGNSMGWYTALAVAGALDFADGLRLVQGMALLQEQGASGGQVIYPLVDADWQPVEEQQASVERALASSEGQAFASITLGGYRVLAGSSAGVAHLLEALPRVKLGEIGYPFRLAQHGPYHTVLARGVAEAAPGTFAGLRFRRPRATLVDGRGRVFSPWSADLEALRAYTFGAQVCEPFDFTTTVRVFLREFAPARLVLPGPGNTLGGVCGQILVAEGWRGIHSRRDFAALQENEEPVIVSMGRG